MVVAVVVTVVSKVVVVVVVLIVEASGASMCVVAAAAVAIMKMMAIVTLSFFYLVFVGSPNALLVTIHSLLSRISAHSPLSWFRINLLAYSLIIRSLDSLSSLTSPLIR